MRCRGFVVGLTAALLAVGSIMIMAGPAGATNSCNESMNPAAGGNSSGLIIACEFDSTGTASSLTISDYADAVWHYGAARNVNVTVARTGGTVGTTAGKTTIKSRPTNSTTVASCANSPSGQTGIPAGNLALSAADVNHSVEFATSSATHAGLFINPGSFIKSVVSSGSGCTQVITVTLSKATLAGGPLCPASPGPTTGSCTNSVGANVLVSNDTGRTLTDGVTTAGSATVTSASAHFLANDVGKTVTAGDLPDGSTISTVNSTTSVTLVCSGCVGGFTGVSSASNLVLALAPNPVPTSARYVTDGSATGTRVLTSASAHFAASDVGLPIVFNPAISTLAGARVGSITSGGGSVTIAGAGTATIPTGTGKKFTLGVATKTAPATGDVAGSLAILLQVNPTVSPTSPPCSANKTSGFQIPLLWKNPGGYDTTVNSNTNQFSGVQPAATSIAQFDFATAPTSFSGYLEQNYTVSGTAQGPSTYSVAYTFLPITVGLCPGTGDATTFNFFGLALKIAQNPSFTGGGGGGERGITAQPQNSSTTYTGSTGAEVTTGAASQPTNTNSCTITSPAALQIGC